MAGLANSVQLQTEQAALLRESEHKKLVVQVNEKKEEVFSSAEEEESLPYAPPRKDSLESPILSEADSQEEISEKKDGKFSLIFWMIFIFLALLFPAVYFMVTDQDNFPNLNPALSSDQLQSLGQFKPKAESVRWSLWLSSTWLIGIFWRYFIEVLPALIVLFVTRIYGFATEKLRERLEYIPNARSWLWTMLTVNSSLLVYALMFSQFWSVIRWQAGIQVIGILAIFVTLTFFQRLFVMSIANNFHRLSYQDRINFSKKSIKVLDKLRAALKVGHLAQVFEMDFKHSPDALGSEADVHRGSLWTIFGKSKNQDDVNQLTEPFQNVTIDEVDPVVDQDGSTDSIEKVSPTSNPIPDETLKRGKLYNSIERNLPHTQALPVAQPESDEKPNLLDDSSPALEKPIETKILMDLENSPPPADLAQRAKTVSFSPLKKESHVITEPIQKSASLPREIPRDISKTGTTLSETSQRSKRTLPKRDSTIGSDSAREQMNNRIKRGILIGGEKLSGHKSLDLLSERNGVRLAHKLFHALCPPNEQVIKIDQFYPYFNSEKEAMDAFAIFDRDQNGDLTAKEVKYAILRIYRERRNLLRSLSDLSHALGKLNHILYGFSAALTVFISLPILGISLAAILPFTSILVALSFIFGNSASTTFNCIIFLFVHHPYDTGDRVFIEGANYIVEELNILTTVFIRADGQRLIAPNCNSYLCSANVPKND